MDFKYVKEPGFVYDLIYILCIVFNKEYIMSELKKRKLSNDDLSFYENIISQCGKLPEDILPFFYINKNSPSFISVFYFMNKTNFENYTVDNLISELSDAELLKNNLNEFYFGATNRFNNNYIDLIENLDLNLNLKYRLARIYSNIARSSEMVIRVIKQINLILKDIYSGFEYIIDERIKYLSENRRVEVLYLINQMVKNKDAKPLITICIINRYGCTAIFHENDFFLLGDDFIEKIDTVIKIKNIDINMIALGKIISDPTRLKMLNLLKEKQEIYTGEMCNILDMTLTAVFYHLNMMLNEKMLKIRNEGRKVYYSINNDYFDSTIQEFLKFKL